MRFSIGLLQTLPSVSLTTRNGIWRKRNLFSWIERYLEVTIIACTEWRMYYLFMHRVTNSVSLIYLPTTSLTHHFLVFHSWWRQLTFVTYWNQFCFLIWTCNIWHVETDTNNRRAIVNVLSDWKFYYATNNFDELSFSLTKMIKESTFKLEIIVLLIIPVSPMFSSISS